MPPGLEIGGYPILALILTVVFGYLAHEDAQQAHSDAVQAMEQAQEDAERARRAASRTKRKTATLSPKEIREIADQLEGDIKP